MKTVIDFVQHAPREEILREATRLRAEHFGNQVEMCMIASAKSGACLNNCTFCAQSAHYQHADIESFSFLSSDDLLHRWREACASRVAHLGIVTSGDALADSEISDFCDFLAMVAKNQKTSPLKICASLGKLNCESLKKLKNAKLTRYHHNLETSQNFYPQLCTTQNWHDRFATVALAREVGLEVCSGGIFGVGESWEDRAELAATLRKLEVNCVPINFLHPRAGTPLASRIPLAADEALRIIALFRLLLPTTSLRVCGGRHFVFEEAEQPEIFAAGADAVMTGNYLTTSGITPERDRAMIVKCGLQEKLVG